MSLSYNEEMDECLKQIWPDPDTEDLCEELKSAKRQVDGKWILQHGLVCTEYYQPSNNAWYNEKLRSQKKQLQYLRDRGEWQDYVSTHEKHFRPIVLEEIAQVAPIREWCKIACFVWYDSDQIWGNQEVWLRIFSDPIRVAGLMDSKETKFFSRQKFPLTVYRGCLSGHAAGMSWTLHWHVAENFKRKAGPRGVIYEGQVNKAYVIAFLNPNSEEFEVVIKPGKVSEPKIVG